MEFIDYIQVGIVILAVEVSAIILSLLLGYLVVDAIKNRKGA